ncbi:hypothetical protein BDQ12DRAFT_754803 [Crucibulum laeve]|uniref:C2H2-type domain-containing protein n=1 Tax=Crucibulum laeve TaxID=68775 RepID=A0A5C3LUM1_9AGAR|nr:hypothetical protein BDQ12DRAFT_754803 [Crucibulum laeve]
MDPRARHALLENAVRYSLEGPKKPMVKSRNLVISNPKRRHATYFPSEVSIEKKRAGDDEISTWEYSAPISHASRSSSTSTCSSTGSTPAQEIVIRYRATQMALNTLAGSSSPSISVYSQDEDEEEDQDIAASFYLESDDDEKYKPNEEAMFVMNAQGVSENEKIVCQRPNCRDTLRDVKALMYHLHIHNIDSLDAPSFECSTCKHHFEGEKQYKAHRCVKRSPSPLMSPIRESFDSFRRVFKRSFYA